MPHPRHALRLASLPSPYRLQIERGPYRLSTSDDCCVLNMMWMNNKAVFLVCYTQLRSSMVMVMVSLMNPYIKASFTMMSIAILYVWTGRYFLSGIPTL